MTGWTHGQIHAFRFQRHFCCGEIAAFYFHSHRHDFGCTVFIPTIRAGAV